MCTNNLKQIGLALQQYQDVARSLPYGANFSGTPSLAKARGGTWAAMILPHLEQLNLFAKFDFTKHIADPANEAAVRTPVAVYVCPSDSSADKAILTMTIQAGVTGNNPTKGMGLWYPTSMGPTADGCSASVRCVYCADGYDSYCCGATGDYGSGCNSGKPGVGVMDREAHAVGFAEIRDGLSNTILAGETIPSQCPFNGAYNHNFPINGTTIPLNTFVEGVYGVNNYWYTACGFKSRHPGGACFAFCDGSVHFLAETIDYRLYNALGTRAGMETLTLP
jgi:prepilin-type processing-associated H-X9-DG protein